MNVDVIVVGAGKLEFRFRCGSRPRPARQVVRSSAASWAEPASTQAAADQDDDRQRARRPRRENRRPAGVARGP